MSDPVNASRQLLDDLQLQAWLARAEQRNPSLHQRVAPLAQTRDDLRLQVHLGKMEATDAWHAAETRWGKLKQRLDRALEDIHPPEDLNDALDEIRTAYKHLRGPA